MYSEYNGNIVLENVSMDIDAHDFIGISGPNGGGKTTFIRCLLGLKAASQGEVCCLRELRKGYLPQINRIDRHFPISVEEVVLSGLNNGLNLMGRVSPSDKLHALDVMRTLGVESYRHEAIGNLSGGQIQRTLFARAIVGRPNLLVLDEPTTYADQPFQQLLANLLAELNKECAIVMISHDNGALLNLSKRRVQINRTLTWL